MVTVREATEADYGSESLIDLLNTWIAECNPDGLDFSPDPFIIRDTYKSLHRPGIGVTLVMIDSKGDNEKIVGCLGLIIHGWGASPVRNFVSENLWYLLPSHSGHAGRMLRSARQWSVNNAEGDGKKYLMFSRNRLSTSRSDGRTEKWLYSHGFRELYSLFIREV